jgi:hypothetical protein
MVIFTTLGDFYNILSFSESLPVTLVELQRRGSVRTPRSVRRRLSDKLID